MLAGLQAEVDPRLLVGPESFDDAGALLLRDDLVVLQTADVIAPVCDAPGLFGAIAATNALSDVYAMGGRPLTAINLAFFPGQMPSDDQSEVLRGAGSKCSEAGAVVVGGHTLADKEPKFGLSVVGICAPAELLRNSGARAGDRLVLTKPIGTGLVLSGMRKGWFDDDTMRPCWQQMAALNDVAAREAVRHQASAATDVTGFGLGGHATEIARASGVTVRIDTSRVPRYEQTEFLLGRGVKTAITDDNLASMEAFLLSDSSAPGSEVQLLADPQTSGGLLVSLPAERADEYVAQLHAEGVAEACVIGEVIPGGAGLLLR